MQKTTVLLFALIASPPALGLPIGNYELIYNALDGTLSVDTQGGGIIGYILQGQGFDPTEQAKPFNGVGESRPDHLSDINPFVSPLSGTIGLGAVLPTGLSAEAFAQQVSGTLYITGLGQSPNAFDLVYSGEDGTQTILPDSPLAENPRNASQPIPTQPSSTPVTPEWLDPTTATRLEEQYSLIFDSTALPAGFLYITLLDDYNGQGDTDDGLSGPVWDHHFLTASDALAPASAPEPGSAALLGFALVGLTRRRTC